MRIAICDDETVWQDKLKKDLAELQSYDNEFDVVSFDSGENLLNIFTDKQFDVVILDIEMKQLNGTETAEIIRKIDRNVIITFLTNYESFALKGYEVGAFRYLLKDQPQDFYFQQLRNIIQAVYNKRKSIPVCVNKEIIKVQVSDITYIEVYGRELYLHRESSDDVLKYKGKLKEAEKMLAGLDFVRTDKSHLVNADKIISSLEGVVTLSDKSSLYISKKYLKDVSAAFMACIKRRCS